MRQSAAPGLVLHHEGFDENWGRVGVRRKAGRAVGGGAVRAFVDAALFQRSDNTADTAR